MVHDEEMTGPVQALYEIERAAAQSDVAALLKALEDPSFDVRTAAALALGRAGGERAKVALLSVARDRRGERPEVRIAALQALGGLYGAGRYASILDGFVTGDNRKVVAAARRMLQAVDPAGYPRRLVHLRCLDHSAISVYGRARESTAVPLLSAFVAVRIEAGDMTRTSNWGKVYAAARALGRIGGADAERTLRSLLDWLSETGTGDGRWLDKERLSLITAAASASIDPAGKG